MMAVLLSAMLVAGMVSTAVPVTVLAQEDGEPAQGATNPDTQETGTPGDSESTNPEYTDKDKPDNSENTNPGQPETGAPDDSVNTNLEEPKDPGTEDKKDDTAKEPGSGIEQPDSGTGQETPEPAESVVPADLIMSTAQDNVLVYVKAQFHGNDMSKNKKMAEEYLTNNQIVLVNAADNALQYGADTSIDETGTNVVCAVYCYNVSPGRYYFQQGEKKSGEKSCTEPETNFDGEIAYAVSFLDSDTELDSQYVQMRGKAVKPADPVKDGYTFAGWVTENGGSTPFDFEGTAITQITNVYASWTADAPDDTKIASGTDWTLDADGRLTISSDAGMEDWTVKNDTPYNGTTYKYLVTSAEIQNSVTKIVKNAFNGCSNLADITLSDNLKSIEGYTFSECSSLEKIKLPENVTSIGTNAFAQCSKLTSVMLSEKLESIGFGAFQGCESLTSITLPREVKNIGNCAFDTCSNLTEVKMSGEIPPTIGGMPFYDCKFFQDVTPGIHVPTGKAQAYIDEWKKTDSDTPWEKYITDDTTPAEKHEHEDDVTFTPWTQTDSLPTAAGNYYLTENVTLTDTWTVPDGETSLCLNGKDMLLTNGITAQLLTTITIPQNATLKLFNCDQHGSGGKISGGPFCGVTVNGCFYMYGGAISENGTPTAFSSAGVRNNGTFYMYGGEIKNNRLPITSIDGFPNAGLVNNGSFYMYGGNIVQNVSDSWGAGVHNLAGKKVVIGGSAVIVGNTDSDGCQNNLFLWSDDMITVDSQNPLSGSARIGVLTYELPEEGTPVNITGANNADYHQCFSSDDPNYTVTDGNDHTVQLIAAPHDHKLTLMPEKPATCTEAGNKAYYHCEGCEKNYEDAAGTKPIADINTWGNIAALGHDWGEWAVTKPATEANSGEKERICKRCQQKETETIPATGSGGDKPGGEDKPGGDTPGGEDKPGGGNKPGGSGGNNGGGNQDSGNSGGNPGDNGVSSGNNGGIGNGSGNSGDNSSSKPGAGASAPGSSLTGQPKVKQEKEGNIQKEVRVEGANTLDASVATPLSELADIVLTKEEKQQAAAGTNIRIVLEVKDAPAAVSAADKTLVETALISSAAKGYTLGQYLDINLYKVVGDSRSAITETNRKITITIDVPDNLKNTDRTKARTFAVIRAHDGRAELLADLDDNANTITIETNRFSTYAIVYKDTAGGNDDGNQGGNGKPGVIQVNTKSDSKNPGGGKDNEPKTGDRTPIELSATLAMIAGLTYLLLYFADRKHGMTEETKKELVSRLVAWAKQGGKSRTYLALAAIFILLVYYHSIGKKMCVEWEEIYVD